MSALDPDQLHVTFQVGTLPASLQFPRRYTLTHSDMTGDLFLTIGAQYDQQQISGLYTRFMHDEVLAELRNEQGETTLHVYVHVSGGLVFGGPFFRNSILHYHMPMVLEALRYGENELFTAHPELDETRVLVHFSARQRRFNKVEAWGRIKEYS